jgi:hypothetical protein
MSQDEYEIHSDIIKQDYDIILDGYTRNQKLEQLKILYEKVDIARWEDFNDKELKDLIIDKDPEGLLDDYFQDLR